MRGSSAAIIRGVNARWIRARSFVWRGGSKKIIHCGVGRFAVAHKFELNSLFSFSARLTPS
jgi:hypothetical protein